jgi:hypothetical protein
MEYSRSYLQSLPDKFREAIEKRNKDIAEKIAYRFIHEILAAAGNGYSSYIYTRTEDEKKLYEGDAPTNSQLILGFQKIFPDCDISYGGHIWNDKLHEYNDTIRISWSYLPTQETNQ